MKQRRVTIKQVAAEGGVSITTIPSVRAPLGGFFGVGHADHAELSPVEEGLPRRWPRTWPLGRVSRT